LRRTIWAKRVIRRKAPLFSKAKGGGQRNPIRKKRLRFREKAGGRGFEANTLSLPSSELMRGTGYFSPLISSLKVIDGP